MKEIFTMARRTFKLIALLMALAFALTGCSMIEVDQEMDDAEVIIKVNDTELLKKDVMNTYEVYKANLLAQYQMYASFGYNISLPSEDEVKQMVVDALVMQEVRKQKAAELGLDQLTDEELATVNENAQTDYDKDYEQVKTNVTEDGMTEEQITAAADKFMADNQLTMDKYVENARLNFVDNKLDEHIYKDLAVTDDEIKAEFDSLVEADKTALEEDETAIDTKVNTGATAYYYPAGFRYVKQVLVKFLEEDTSAISDINKQIREVQSQIDSFATAAPTTAPEATEAPADATEAPTAEPTEQPTEEPTADPEATPAPTMDPTLPTQLDELNAQLAAAQQTARDNIQARVDEVYQKAIAGEDFDALIAEYGEDTGTDAEPVKTYGYIVGPNTNRFVAAFKDAAMALANVGDVSEPVETTYGMHILKYTADIPEGAAEMTDYIKTTISDSLMAKKKEETRTAAEEEWKSAAKVETNIGEMVSYN